MKRLVWRAMPLLALLGALGALLVISGIVPIKASSRHWAITAWFLQFAKQRSVWTHSLGVKAPDLSEPRLVMMGAGHYEGGCRFCHGAPGSGQPRIVLQMTPYPPELSSSVERYDDGELFSIVRHGIKFTGMPAWPAPSRDDEVWAVVAFLRKLPELDRAAYRELVLADDVPATDGAPPIVGARCARCHGADGLGREGGAFPRLAAQRPEYLRSALEAYASGSRHSGIMQPIAAELAGPELRAIVDWYAGRPPPRAVTASGSQRGAEIAERGILERRVPACKRCHGPSETEHHPGHPRLSSQYPEYLEQQLRLFNRGARGGGPYAKLMQAAVDHALQPGEIREVARHYAAQSAAE
jgi:cytochrome c553